MTQFDTDIALSRERDGGYRIDINDRWHVNVGPNGGYIAAIILNGMKIDIGPGAAHTRSITFHFLSAAKPGPARLEIVQEKLGRTLSTATARLRQGDRTIAIGIATFGAARESAVFCDIEPPSVPPPDKIEQERHMGRNMPGHAPFRDHYDQLLAIGPMPPGTSAHGHVGGWSRFREHRPFDDLAIVAISDSWYPSFMARSLPGEMHAPTVDHSVHFMQSLPLASIAADDFILVEFTTEVASEGYLIEDGRMWAPDGTLIARSRQLAVLMPRD